MNYEVGDIVKCTPSGPHPGPRIGKIKTVQKLGNGNISRVVLVGYIDYPEESGGWHYGIHAWVRPIGIILKHDHNK